MHWDLVPGVRLRQTRWSGFRRSWESKFAISQYFCRWFVQQLVLSWKLWNSRLRALLVCDRDQYEVVLQSPLRCVTAAALSQTDVEKRFPRGTPSDCNHLFLVAIRKQTESTEYIFACKQRFDNWYAVPPVRNVLEQFTSMNGLSVSASLFVVRVRFMVKTSSLWTNDFWDWWPVAL